ncbi:MAG: hypothetical protein KC708_02830 [Anaerolineae bacterium]|nr:hypothetical protein [Anaerolineae bacterium]
MVAEIVFKKKGKDIREAIHGRIEGLESRLVRRNVQLDALLDDRNKLRSYLIRSSGGRTLHSGKRQYVLIGENDISSEEKEEIDQMLRRISEIEQEIYRLKMISEHLDPNETYPLDLGDLISYGFSTFEN